MSQTPQNKASQNAIPAENGREQIIMERLFQIFEKDSQRKTAVVQSVSLFFWDNLNQWAQQIALEAKPFTIALSGPSGSGKSFIREALVRELAKVSKVSSFTQDNYYRDFEADFPHLPLALFYDQIDFDDPDHIRFRHLGRDLQRFKAQPLGSGIQIPKLRFGTPGIKPAIIEEALHLPVTPFLVTEGIHAFYEPAILPFYDFKIYVDIDEKTRRQRWLARNIQENRGVTNNMWNTTVQCLERHISPTRTVADLVINNNAPASQVRAFLSHFVTAIGIVLRGNRQNIA